MAGASPASTGAHGTRTRTRREPLHHGVLIVDKPSGPTSHDVVRLVRRAYGTRAVGHAGTLDPLASGVLVIGIGEATKLLHHLTGSDKIYLATVKLGAATDTLDAQGKVLERAPLPPGHSLASVAQVAARFVGQQWQRVPEISAIKQQGVPLYERVRRGESVIAPERSVLVHSLEVLRFEADEIDLRVHCGKGFYVRSLARDLALALGSVGHISHLRRVASGQFSLDDALACSELERAPQPQPPTLLSPAAALRGQPRLTLTTQGLIEVSHGRALRLEHVLEAALPSCGSEPVALLDEQGRLRALGRAEEDRVAVARGIAAV
jgi:tRNA pseudouridine55 synthase